MKIIGVVIKDTWGKTWKLPAPNRHADLIQLMVKTYISTTGKDETPKILFQGFYTDTDEILSRTDAYQLVNTTGQKIINRPSQQLYSEDLW